MTSETPGRRAQRRGWPRRGVPSRRGRRRLAGVVRLAGALMLAGMLYTLVAPGQGLAAAQEDTLSPDALQGQEIFDQTCISCHGRNAQGVEGRGPSLIGVGAAAVEFQVSTGRMPAARQEAQAPEKPPIWEGEELEENTRYLAAYIQELGGGPQIPAGITPGDPAAGGELFRLNCASCHAYSGGGGTLSSGAFAPALRDVTDRQLWGAMLTGPQNMPVFGDNQLTPEEKADIIAYINTLTEDGNPGGVFDLGRLGPSTEGLAIFLVGMVVTVLATLWIAGKS